MPKGASSAARRALRAGDAMHSAQGASTRPMRSREAEQQISHVRENRSRIEQRIASLRAQLENGATQLAAAQANLEESRTQSGSAQERLAKTEAALRMKPRSSPRREAYRASQKRRDALQRALAQTERALHVEATKLEHADASWSSSRSAKSGCAKKRPLCLRGRSRARTGCATKRTSRAVLEAQRGGLAEREAELAARAGGAHRVEALEAVNQSSPAWERESTHLRSCRSGSRGAPDCRDWLARAVSIARHGCGRASRSKAAGKMRSNRCCGRD